MSGGGIVITWIGHQYQSTGTRHCDYSKELLWVIRSQLSAVLIEYTMVSRLLS